MLRAASFLIFFALIATCSDGSTSRIIQLPAQPLPSFKINATQPVNQRNRCSFRVIIRTSCASVRYTRDGISLSFGDDYGNQVYAPRLDDPRSGTFESCSSDTFDINGPCTYQICYLYLYRSGLDGWRPYDVTVSGYNTRPVTFYYDVFIPRDVWYGFNNCYYSGAAADKSAMKKWMLLVVLTTWSINKLLDR